MSKAREWSIRLENFDEVVKEMSMVQLPVDSIEELSPIDSACIYAEETRAVSEEGCRLLLQEALKFAECSHCCSQPSDPPKAESGALSIRKGSVYE